MTDIVERLRARIRHFDEASLLHEFLHYLKSDAALDKEAANEIERLLAEVERLQAVQRAIDERKRLGIEYD